jgi:hypothetical protein
MKENKAIIKWNNGNLALLCSNCSVIIKTGYSFTKDELDAVKGKFKLKAQYCEKCNNIRNDEK